MERKEFKGDVGARRRLGEELDLRVPRNDDRYFVRDGYPANELPSRGCSLIRSSRSEAVRPFTGGSAARCC